MKLPQGIDLILYFGTAQMSIERFFALAFRPSDIQSNVNNIIATGHVSAPIDSKLFCDRRCSRTSISVDWGEKKENQYQLTLRPQSQFSFQLPFSEISEKYQRKINETICCSLMRVETVAEWKKQREPEQNLICRWISANNNWIWIEWVEVEE